MSWLELAPDDPFGLATLPYGVLDTGSERLCAVRIGDRALPLAAAADAVSADFTGLFSDDSLDRLLAAGPATWDRVRQAVTGWLTDEQYRTAVEPLLLPLTDCRPVLPFTVADYVDFYASENHASNVGRIFRPNGEPLTPNWKHLPIGYHGRAGTVVISGTDIRRPNGQRRVAEEIAFGECLRLDIEAEVGYVVGAGSDRPVSTGEFDRHVFGVVLLNDWSARDLQAWEYVPLGPFLGKSFATSISGWITPLAALRSARVPAVARDPQPLPYLDDTGDSWNLDLRLQVRLNGELLSTPPYRSMYWTPSQMLTHMCSNGASLRSGDLYGSGTVSGSEPDQRGSLLELSWGGTEPITLGDGSTRTFLLDGDEVSIVATAPGPDGNVIGLAEVTGRIVPALPLT